MTLRTDVGDLVPIGAPRRIVIGKPRQDPRLTKTWSCAVHIEGIPKQKHRRGYGVDAVQALQDAMLCARRALDASGLRLTWLDGEPGALDLLRKHRSPVAGRSKPVAGSSRPVAGFEGVVS